MARHGISNPDGTPATGSHDRPLFYSDSDGDSKDRQTVYESGGKTINTLTGDCTKVDGTKYDPSTGEFKKS